MDSKQSLGGHARAAKLTGEQRREIARAAAAARWENPASVDLEAVPQATHTGELTIGDLTIPCAVLEDGTRLLTERGVSNALGKTRSGSHWKKKREEGSSLPLYLTAANLRPYISDDLIEAFDEPFVYRSPYGGRPLVGIKATSLPSICEAWLRARDAGVLVQRQMPIAAKADLLVRALAQVGIIALVDEATGYQEVRSRSALEAILNKYLTDELRKWTKTFPDEYFANIFRLRGWSYPEIPTHRPGAIAQYTNNYVYSRLAPGVLDELRARNPTDGKGRRRFKHHQHLSDDYGDPRLKEHIGQVILLMKASTTWATFNLLMDRALPKLNSTLELPFNDIE